MSLILTAIATLAIQPESSTQKQTYVIAPLNFMREETTTHVLTVFHALHVKKQTHV